jgi:ribosomal-protein-alanine N-acetyltransferase
MSTAWIDRPREERQARVSVRGACPGDLDAVMGIERACFAAPWPRSVMADEIGGRSCSRVEVAEEAQGVTGFMIYWVIPPEAHLINLAVAPAARGRGIGRAMVQRLMAVAREESVSQVFLEVRASNLVAQRLYIGAGFEQIDVRRGYYADNGEDALVMYVEVG